MFEPNSAGAKPAVALIMECYSQSRPLENVFFCITRPLFEDTVGYPLKIIRYRLLLHRMFSCVSILACQACS